MHYIIKIASHPLLPILPYIGFILLEVNGIRIAYIIKVITNNIENVLK